MARWSWMPIKPGFTLLGYRTRLLSSQKRCSTSNAFVTPAVPLPTDFTSIEAHVKPSYDSNTKNNPLKDKLIAIKDSICTKDFPTTCASNILGDFKSPYNATVVELLQQAGAVIQGKTNMDEFGMGSHTTLSRFGAVRNYAGVDNANEALSAGGSSGGSAMAIREGQAWAALGTDTGGSVRLPAAYTGTVGFKPSYGLLSRFGVVAYANSLDTVGILARDIDVVRLVFGTLSKHDFNDPTSLSEHTRSRIARTTNQRDNKVSQSMKEASKSQTRYYKIGVPQEYNIEELAAPVQNAWKSVLALLQSRGHSIHSVSLPTTPQALSAYYVLAPAEACSNLAKYDGVRYGQRANAMDDEAGYLFARTRGEGFGKEVRRRILLGTYSLSAAAMDNYFIQAQRVRRLVQQDFDAAFGLPNPLHSGPDDKAFGPHLVDVIVVPTAPTLPPKLSSIEHASPLDAYVNDVFTVPASLAGLPAASIPWLMNEHSTDMLSATAGFQVIGQFGDDSLVLQAAQDFYKASRSNSL